MDKDSEEEDANQENKLERLEEEVKNVREMIVNTLTDIRILINELENPFEYLSKFVDKLPEGDEGGEYDKGVKEKDSSKSKEEVEGVISKGRETHPEKLRVETESLKKDARYEPSAMEKVLYKASLGKRGSRVYERALLVGDFLLKTFGKDSVHKMLHLFYRRGLITTEIYMTMLDVIENLNLEIDFSYLEKPITPEDYILALYLLNRVEDLDENEIFLILLMALKRTYQKEPNIQNILPKIFRDLGKGGEDDKHSI